MKNLKSPTKKSYFKAVLHIILISLIFGAFSILMVTGDMRYKKEKALREYREKQIDSIISRENEEHNHPNYSNH